MWWSVVQLSRSDTTSSYWPGIPGHKRRSGSGLNALTLTDITKNATYGVEMESLVLEINAPASS
ncbi:hypothetical protein [Escherichia coli]|uniref:hypothetical protein n=1 Tax=Escherichia coli TaxID=562 RepID=UPI001600622C|nr:hypothetical protein [Escherichia coli]